MMTVVARIAACFAAAGLIAAVALGADAPVPTAAPALGANGIDNAEPPARRLAVRLDWRVRNADVGTPQLSATLSNGGDRPVPLPTSDQPGTGFFLVPMGDAAPVRKVFAFPLVVEGQTLDALAPGRSLLLSLPSGDETGGDARFFLAVCIDPEGTRDIEALVRDADRCAASGPVGEPTGPVPASRGTGIESTP